MQYFNFTRLIEKYSQDLTVEIPAEGKFNEKGVYEAGKVTKENIRGAVIRHKKFKSFRNEGTVATIDSTLYVLKKLPNAFTGCLLNDGNNLYHIGAELENGAFTGVYAYDLKYHSAFDKKEGAE